jgi:circadian clock protein KaiC
MNSERVSTGIAGLDSKMKGGFVRGSANLVAGKAGTGKTGFSASFLYKGALEGEPGVYVTTEESEADIKADIKSVFGWDLEKL